MDIFYTTIKNINLWSKIYIKKHLHSVGMNSFSDLIKFILLITRLATPRENIDIK